MHFIGILSHLENGKKYIEFISILCLLVEMHQSTIFHWGVKLTLVTCEVSPSSVRMAASPGVFREDPLTSEELTTLVTTLLVASGEDLEVKTLS